MNRSNISSLLLLPLALGASGCQDLAVENVTDPDRRAALSEAQAVENLIASSWNAVWEVTQDDAEAAGADAGPPARIPGYADEATSNHRDLQEYTREPRAAFPNSQTGSARFLVEAPWFTLYEGAANAMDGVFAIRENDIQLFPDEGAATPEAATHRAQVFAWLNHGVLYGYLAMIFDQARLADADTDLTDAAALEYRPYPEVQQFAIRSLERAIDMAQSGPAFRTPPTWMGGVSMTNQELAQLANSYIARLLVYTPRTPQERAAVDWDRVLRHIDAGITESFVPTMARGGLTSAYFQYLQQVLAQRWSIDIRLIGPADVSGRYAQWVQAPLEDRDHFAPERLGGRGLEVVTPDRRIMGPEGTRDPGKYIYWAGDFALSEHNQIFYLYGLYKWGRFMEGGAFPWEEGPNPMIPLNEMTLLAAEAHLRKGNQAEAARLINITRVNNGELPPVTAAGVPGDLSSCVPRTQDGQRCGTLLDALHHERLIEGIGMDVWLTWFNRRGFGTLQEGTFLHLPVPARELESFREQVYTFGGGGPFSADANWNVE